MKKEWKDSYIYGDIYSVSNFGRVKNKFTNHIKVPNTSGKGYARVMLKKKGFKSVFARVHRLVAEAFLENPDCLLQVNHKDGNKINNCVENLEWCSDEQNRKHALLNGLVPESAKAKRVLDRVNNITYDSIRIAAKNSGCFERCISKSAKRKSNKTRWEFL